MDESNWYQNAVFYEVPVQAFYDSNGDGIGDLAGLTAKLDYLVSLGVDCVWLLPFYESPLRDGGYDISDYRKINPIYGDLTDFMHLLEEAHRRNLKILLDLVMNHTSDQHFWFQQARSHRDSPFHDYYVWSETDQKYQDARIIFLDTEKSNWSWNESTQEYYWHRFYSHQPDLNYDNPKVLHEILEIIDFWMKMGIDGFRMDAVPYLIEREGTICENLPETHAILKQVRAYVDLHYPGKLLLCEANQWPEDVMKYLGQGDEFHMAFNFPLMPRIFMALKKEDSTPIKWAMDQLPPIPNGCQWGTFLRNHDELTLEMVTEDERQFMWKEYSPDKRYRLNLGIRRRLAPLLDHSKEKIELAYSLLFSLPGSPFIYYGDEIGMGDNVDLFDRDGLRTPMQWDGSPNAGFSLSPRLYAPVIPTSPADPSNVNVSRQMQEPDSLWHTLQQMISLRRQNPGFTAGDLQWVQCDNSKALVFKRVTQEQTILFIHNLSHQSFPLTISLAGEEISHLVDLFGRSRYETDPQNFTINLSPYQYCWLKVERE